MIHWAAAGKSNGQIATVAHVSPRTGHEHLDHIYVKLDLENRTAAAMCARAIP